LAETLGEGPDADEGDSAAAAAEAAGPADIEDESDPDCEAAVLGAAAAEAVVPAGGLFDAVAYAAAVVDEKGYVTCPVPPWSELLQVGQITSWPKTKPPEKRSWSCRCFAHYNCKSPAKNGVTQAMLLRWLFSGTCEPMCIGSRSEVLRKEHETAFHPIITGLQKAAVAASSSSAAGSSAASAAAS
jgi:hypothetical protein